jgi:hypothetical protein
MNLETVTNLASNCTIAFSSAALLIHIFGDPDNAIWDNNIKAYLAKFGLSVTTCGAILNVLSLSTPNRTEIILNVGMSLTFFWLSWWQWEQFHSMKKAAKKVKPKSARKPRTPRTKITTKK